ncbi:hypothetical protein [Pedobacter mucosus]|uniref:hypothetical protein n=1 Tax=Pedobacter mucosus TaxID=2895286 RepID=UPI001EE487B1|nr:hypothetical protein [Pedobacter mucosus]UKT65084.1 hypothetical protein LOK61_04730 [Pedobacter mucosus]
MKNQSINSVNAKADFVDLNAKNPIYQALAGRVPNAENRAEITDDGKKTDVNPASKTDEDKAPEQAPKSVGAVVLTEQKAQEKKTEKVEPKTEKPALNLESTLKLVEELHRRMVQRGRLVHTIDNLDKFELEQKEEAEDTTSNYYQGCELEIFDDKRNKFSTKNPVIIRAVATFVRDLCTNRLGEIEAEITIPA